MGFGAFWPLPLRLGTGTWTAAEYARLANDVASVARAAPLAVVRVSKAPDRAITWYQGRNGVGLVHAPTLTKEPASESYHVTWPATFVDELGRTVRWSIYHAEVSAEYEEVLDTFGSFTWQDDGSNSVWVWCHDPLSQYADCLPFVLAVYGEMITEGETDYYGDSGLEDCQTERVPYAAQYYRMLQDAQGTAYSKELVGLNHVENLAYARGYGWQHRLVEKWGNEQTPGTAVAKLQEWCSILNVAVRSTDSETTRRGRAVSAYRAINGATTSNVDDAIAALLGSWYVRTWRAWNDSMTPATITYGPGNPGPGEWDIGGGTWASEHANLVIETREPTDAERGAFLTLVNVDLFQLLDRLLPDHMTWEWATNVEDGFRLDYGSLDYEGMNEE